MKSILVIMATLLATTTAFANATVGGYFDSQSKSILIDGTYRKIVISPALRVEDQKNLRDRIGFIYQGSQVVVEYSEVSSTEIVVINVYPANQ